MTRDPSSRGYLPSDPPDPLRSALHSFARRARDKPALDRLDNAAAEAFDAFDAAGVDALLLKGPALARTLYTPVEHRGYSDVDLLVAPADIPMAERILGELGYTNLADHLGIGDVAGTLSAETWVGVATTATAEAAPQIDLHWRLPGAQASPESAWAALTRERGVVGLAGRRVPTLAVDALALHLATHAAQHGPGQRQPVEDLARGLERWASDVWRGAARLATEIEATEAFGAGLRLLPRGAAVASDLGLPGTGRLEWEIAHRDGRPRGTFHLQALSEARTLRERASVLRRSLVPRREWIACQYPWARGTRVRMIGARGLHVMRAPLWAARAWRFRRRAGRAGVAGR
jgi:hypothetical protein